MPDLVEDFGIAIRTVQTTLRMIHVRPGLAIFGAFDAGYWIAATTSFCHCTLGMFNISISDVTTWLKGDRVLKLVLSFAMTAPERGNSEAGKSSSVDTHRLFQNPPIEEWIVYVVGGTRL